MTVQELMDLLANYNSDDIIKLQYQDDGGYYSGCGDVEDVIYDADKDCLIIL